MEKSSSFTSKILRGFSQKSSHILTHSSSSLLIQNGGGEGQIRSFSVVYSRAFQESLVTENPKERRRQDDKNDADKGMVFMTFLVHCVYSLFVRSFVPPFVIVLWHSIVVL